GNGAVHGSPVCVFTSPLWQRAGSTKDAVGTIAEIWSGRRDLNSRPPAPHAGTLPGCATPRGGGSIPAKRPAAALAQQVDDALELLLDVREIDAAAVRRARCRGRRRTACGGRAAALVEPVTRSADGESLLVEELADTANEQHLVVLVVPAVSAALHRAKLGEFLLPVTQHVRLDPAQLAHFADGEVALGGNRRQVILGRLAFH